MMISTISFCGATLAATDFGMVTAIASDGLNLVVKIKNDNNRKATSHIAVMSMLVLLRGNLALPIVYYLIFHIIRFKSLSIPQKTVSLFVVSGKALC